MLTADLLVARRRGGSIQPRYVPTDGPPAEPWLTRAGVLIDLYRDHVGRRRGELDDAVRDLTVGRPDFKVDRGLAKLLEDKTTFEGLGHDEAAARRASVFAAAAAARQAGAFDRDAILADHGFAAPDLDLDQVLYGDQKRNERVAEVDLPTPRQLLTRYNLALAQAVLLRAVWLEVTVNWADPPRLRQLLRHVKFHGLLQEATRRDDGGVYLRLDGPMSIFSATPRYGVKMAGFLPALLLCEAWELSASIQLTKGRRKQTFTLTPEQGLETHRRDTGAWLPELIERFGERFAEVAGDAYTVDTNVPFLNLGGEVAVPDFRFTHAETGWRACLEVLGYWRRGGVARRLKALKTHGQKRLILAVDQSLKLDNDSIKGLEGPVLAFRELPSPRKVKKLLDALREADPDPGSAGP